MSENTRSERDERERVERLMEQHQQRAGESGDELAQAVDRHREDFGLPEEPADGEDATSAE